MTAKQAPQHPPAERPTSRKVALKSVHWGAILSALIVLAGTSYFTDLVKTPDVLIWQSPTRVVPDEVGRLRFETTLINLSRRPVVDTVQMRFLVNCPPATIYNAWIDGALNWTQRATPRRIDAIRHDFILPAFPLGDSVVLNAVVTSSSTPDCTEFRAHSTKTPELQPKSGRLLWLKLTVIPWVRPLAFVLSVTLILLAFVALLPRAAHLLPQKQEKKEDK